MLTTLFILGALLLVAYIATFCIKNRTIPASISETYYLVKKPAVFSLILIASMVLITPKMMEAIPEKYTAFAFFFCGSMMFIAAAPNFEEKGMQRAVHLVGATMLIVSSFFYTGFICGWLHLLWIVYLAGIICHTLRSSRKDKMPVGKAFLDTKPLFWAECLIILTIFAAVLI